MLTAICEYSSVIAGAQSLKRRIRSGVKTTFKALVTQGTLDVIKRLQESYKTAYAGGTPRASWTRSGNLQRVVFSAVSFGRGIPGCWIAGIGEINVLDSSVPYWREIEEGTAQYVGKEFRGFFADISGKPYAPREKEIKPGQPYPAYYGRHKWVPDGQHTMKVGKPILPHRFYEKGAQDISKRFEANLAFIIGALA